jgi:hypothetical protein
MEAREAKRKRLAEPTVFDHNAVQRYLLESIWENQQSSAAVIQMARPKRLPCGLFELAIEFAADPDLDQTSENFIKFAMENISVDECEKL